MTAHLTSEDVSGGAERLSGRGVEREGEELADGLDNRLHDAQVVQHGDHRTEVDYHGQYLDITYT